MGQIAFACPGCCSPQPCPTCCCDACPGQFPQTWVLTNTGFADPQFNFTNLHLNCDKATINQCGALAGQTGCVWGCPNIDLSFCFISTGLYYDGKVWRLRFTNCGFGNAKTVYDYILSATVWDCCDLNVLTFDPTTSFDTINGGIIPAHPATISIRPLLPCNLGPTFCPACRVFAGRFSPDSFNLVTSGFTNASIPNTCLECVTLNGTFILVGVPGSCLWQDAALTWSLSFNLALSRFELYGLIGGTCEVLYTCDCLSFIVAAGSSAFNIVMTLAHNLGCATVPPTITLTNTLCLCQCVNPCPCDPSPLQYSVVHHFASGCLPAGGFQGPTTITAVNCIQYVTRTGNAVVISMNYLGCSDEWSVIISVGPTGPFSPCPPGSYIEAHYRIAAASFNCCGPTTLPLVDEIVVGTPPLLPPNTITVQSVDCPGESAPPPGPLPCPCPALPAHWKVTPSGITPGLCSECDSFIGGLNRTFTMDSSNTCSATTGVILGPCFLTNFGITEISLTFDRYNNQWNVFIQLEDVSNHYQVVKYVLPAASFNCLGNNTFTLASQAGNTNICNTFPNTLTLVPA